MSHYDEEMSGADLGAPNFDEVEQGVEPEEIKPEPPKESSGAGELLAVGLTMAFQFIATRKGEHWQLQKNEAEQLAAATDEVIEKHWPDFQSGPELTLAFVGIGIVTPRIMMDKKLENERAQNEKKQSDNKTTEHGAAE